MNNSEKVWWFLLKLCSFLQSQDQDWREKTVIMLDNAPYHRSLVMMNKYKQFKVPIMFLGPYQFSMAPVEKIFSFLKQHDLNFMQSSLTNK
jgi:transposase